MLLSSSKVLSIALYCSFTFTYNSMNLPHFLQPSSAHRWTTGRFQILAILKDAATNISLPVSCTHGNAFLLGFVAPEMMCFLKFIRSQPIVFQRIAPSSLSHPSGWEFQLFLILEKNNSVLPDKSVLANLVDENWSWKYYPLLHSKIFLVFLFILRLQPVGIDCARDEK